MKKTPRELNNEVTKARRELASLQTQIAKAHQVLTRLDQEVIKASNMWAIRHPQLVEANERLVVATLNAHNEIEARAQALEELAITAEIDPLTKLSNRILLFDRLTHSIAVAKRNSTQLAVLFVDLNKFKDINDTFGHAAGDEVLKRAAYCFTSSVREVDTVSRHGGDEFVILLAEVSQASDAVLIADKVLLALATPVPVGDKIFGLTASIGISLYPEHGEDPDTLIARADTAMYQAKKRKLGSLVYCGD